MKKLIYILLCLVPASLYSQPYAAEISRTVMNLWPDSFSLGGKSAKWTYDMGVILKGIEYQWLNTGDGRYFKYIQKQMDYFVDEKGNIKTYSSEEYNIDHINNGRLLLTLYKVTQKEKYLTAAKQLREQLRKHPRTKEGGFWHKKIYPNQMWLDGLYMAEPFYAEFAQFSHDTLAFEDIALQFIWAENHLRDESTGLLFHGWDESKKEKWADPQTGRSPQVWARAMGWYAAALVDVLDWFPKDHPRYIELTGIANRLAKAIVHFQDSSAGLWLDVLNYSGPGKEKNYFEASASAQFVYFLAKGQRQEIFNDNYDNYARKGLEGIRKSFVVVADTGLWKLTGTVKVSGLGNKPYRDGSFDYYMSEPVIENDPKGLGMYLMAEGVMQMNLPTGEVVAMDNYFNREMHKDVFGKEVPFHYKWWERDNGGYYFVSHIINRLGASTTTLNTRPSKKSLKNVAVYFIIDPDWPKENKNPNYIEKKDIKVIRNYVKNGGVLLLMANDSNNVEFDHFNQLAREFGFQWNINVRHDVKNDHFEDGAVDLNQAGEIFGNAGKGYIKQLCTQTLVTPAKAGVKTKVVYQENGEIFMTVAQYGKGTVFAVGDPWFYNEYIDGRKLPSTFNNYEAATALFRMLLQNASKK